jgi:hypothetical protein
MRANGTPLYPMNEGLIQKTHTFAAGSTLYRHVGWERIGGCSTSIVTYLHKERELDFRHHDIQFMLRLVRARSNTRLRNFGT